MRELAGIACAGVSCGNPPLGKFHGHHVINIVKDNLVAVQQHDPLHNSSSVPRGEERPERAAYLVLCHSPRCELLPGALVDLAISRSRLDFVDNNGGDARGCECLHVLGVGFDLPSDHDLELVLGTRLLQGMVENQCTSKVTPVGEQSRPDLGGVIFGSHSGIQRGRDQREYPRGLVK